MPTNIYKVTIEAIMFADTDPTNGDADALLTDLLTSPSRIMNVSSKRYVEATSTNKEDRTKHPVEPAPTPINAPPPTTLETTGSLRPHSTRPHQLEARKAADGTWSNVHTYAYFSNDYIAKGLRMGRKATTHHGRRCVWLTTQEAKAIRKKIKAYSIARADFLKAQL
jgi:hypothetical protein